MLNKVILIGRASLKPAVKESQSGTKYCPFSLATNTGYGEKKQTDWHDVTAFGKLAELCEQLIDKGTMIYLEGRIQYNTYERDGKKQKSTKIIADVITVLSSKQHAGESSAEQPEPQASPNPDENPFDDPMMQGIPF
jgi:single-strand DNA-binding protein